MPKGKKQALTLIGLCLLLAVGIVLYFVVPKGEDADSDEDSTTDTVRVMSIDEDSITQVSIQSKEGDDISLKKENDTWTMDEMPDAPIDQDTVESLFNNVSPVTASKELDVGTDDLAEYGLDEPQMTVKITTSEGEEYELLFGDTVPTSGGNYGMTADGDKIYTFSETLYSSFDVERNSLITKEEVADIDADYLTLISIKNKNKTTFHAEIVSDEEKVDAYTNWVISKPYEKKLAGSLTDDWTTLEGFYTSVTFQDLVEYGCSNMKKYGLDEPSAEVKVGYFELKDGYEEPEDTDSSDDSDSSDSSSSVTKNTSKAPSVPEEYRDNKSYTLYIGDTNEDGDYYVRLKGSKNVYTLAQSSVTNMTGVDAYTYMDHSVYATLATDLQGYDVTLGSGKSAKTIHVTHTTEKDEDDKDKNVWTLNGTTVSDDDEETFLTPFSKAFLLEFTSTAKKKVKSGDEPVLSIVYHEDSRDVTVTYYPYDGTNFYRVDKDGMNYFLVDKLAVDDVIESFESLLELDQ
jgi:hypothetical protein